MSIKKFAERYRLKLTSDECGDAVIRGRHGEISIYSDTLLHAAFHGEGAAPFNRTRAKRIRKALTDEIGTRTQGGAGGDEACFSFDPAEVPVAKWFIAALGIKRKRKMSAAMLERLDTIRRSTQFGQVRA